MYRTNSALLTLIKRKGPQLYLHKDLVKLLLDKYVVKHILMSKFTNLFVLNCIKRDFHGFTNMLIQNNMVKQNSHDGGVRPQEIVYCPCCYKALPLSRTLNSSGILAGLYLSG